MRQGGFNPRWLVLILLLAFFGVALYLRVVPAYDGVFVGDIVKFNQNDAYYYLRQIDSFVHNFPQLFSVDPYLNYPNGSPLGSMNFFVYLLGSITWLIGLGAPSAHMSDTICAYFPAVVGALTVIPVYFIGKALFDRKVGILAAALIAILPGEFMARTTLGATDRDALEILLTTLTILFLTLAVKSARQKQLTFLRLNPRNLPFMTRPIIYSVLTGILLGLCLLTWRGSFLFVLVVLVYFILQSIVDHLEHKPFDYLSFVGILTFLVALLIFWALSHSQLYAVVLAISLLSLPVLSSLDWLLIRRKIKAAYYPLGVIGIGLFGLGIFYAVSPTLFMSILDQLSVFAPTQSELTISEMESILFPGGYFTIEVIWYNYTTSLFLSFTALCILIYLFCKRKRSDGVLLLLVVWSTIMLIATLNLRRIAPFFAINVALLTGYLAIILYYVVRFILNYVTGRSNDYVSSRLLESVVSNALTTVKPSEASAKSDYYEVLGVPRNATRKQIKRAHRQLVSKYRAGGILNDEDRERFRQINRAYAVLSDSHERSTYPRPKYGAARQKQSKIKTGKRSSFHISSRISVAIAGLVIFFLIFFPNFYAAGIAVNEEISFSPSDAWYDSLFWLADNTPEPFGDAAFYYDPYQTPLYYPETAYTVTAWWDYGYWILRIGHRLPSCDPGGGDRETVARLFTAQDEATTNELADKLNSKYIIFDDATVSTMFYAVAIYSGTSSQQFFDIYYVPIGDVLVPLFYYYPEYYQSLAVRLYYFDGKKVIPDSTTVISYAESLDPEGTPYKEILSAQPFSTFEEAVAYVSKQTSGNYKIASADPSASPVPLDSLENYRLVYYSGQSTSAIPSMANIAPSVKIFEYAK